ncbi:unnamed protein product [Microthlaspi erraticum]|uniref:Pentacotripeptide-repeat region of PRORP domain-containing protein n=1 Tax=Microthlaspi erraticum TaxID=1685480 RepID=A0A6D2I9J6_9BRAS|nr:unnamed protein product [Microthlaspi erraticum]
MISRTQILQQQARRILATSSRSCLFPRSYKTLSAVKTDLELWQKQGHQVKPSYVRGLIKNLRDTNEFSKALEASEWMCEQRVFNIFSEDYAARLHLVETVLGLEEAENFFKTIPENMRDSSVYDTLLRSYTKSEKTLDKAESTFEKMRELGFLLKPSPFHSMISLYGQLNKQDMVKKYQCELKENNVETDNLKALEKSKTLVDEKGTNLERDRIAAKEEADLRAETLIIKEIEMYGDVPGSKRQVYRLWDEYKKQDNRNKDDGYRCVISSLLKHDDVQGAEKIYGEWEPYEFGPEMDMSIPDLLISRYRAEGNESKVDEVVKSIRKKKIMVSLKIATEMISRFLQQQARRILSSSSRSCLFRRSYKTLSAVKTYLEQWLKQGHQVKPSYVRGLIKNLRDTNEFSKALEASEWMCEQRVFNIFPEDYAARFHLVETVLGLEEAEKFFKTIPENMRDYSVYDTLLRSYTKSEKTLDKAESTFEKMRDLGFLLKPSPFHSMISLYGNIKKQDMVEKLLCELKENNMEADYLTENYFSSLVKTYKAIEKSKTLVDENGTNLESDMIAEKEEACRRAGKIEKAIEMYGDVPGSEREVYRLWDEYKKQDNMYKNDGYRSVISSLLKQDDEQGAEKIYGEWDPFEYGPEMESIQDLLISRYRAEGNESKVKEVVKSIRKKKIMLALKFATGLIFLGLILGMAAIHGFDRVG